MLFDDLQKQAVPVDVLQKSAVKLCGENLIFGASLRRMADDPTKKIFLFYSLALGKIYYIYAVEPNAHTVMKMLTEKYPPPNPGDKKVRIWSTRPDDALASTVRTLNTMAKTDALKPQLKYYEFD